MEQQRIVVCIDSRLNHVRLQVGVSYELGDSSRLFEHHRSDCLGSSIESGRLAHLDGRSFGTEVDVRYWLLIDWLECVAS